MYYPFRKQIHKTYNIKNIDEPIKRFSTFLFQILIVFAKIIGIIMCICFLISLVEITKVKILYRSISPDEIVTKANDLILILNEYADQLTALSEQMDKGLVSNVINSIISLILNISEDLQKAVDILLSSPTEPITSQTVSNYLTAASIFYGASTSLSYIALLLGVIPAGVDLEVPVSDLATEIFTLGDMVLEKYNTTVVPIIESTESVWGSLVTPTTSIINSILLIIYYFTGLAFIFPIIFGTEGTVLGLPAYFWLMFAISIIMLLVMIILNLVKVASSSKTDERNSTMKNTVFGLGLTFTSFFIVPAIFSVVIILFVIIIDSLFAVSILGSTEININTISYMLVANSTKHGAEFLYNFDKPYGYLDGEVILLTKTYFDYTLYGIFSVITIISLFILAAIMLVNIFAIIQYMIIGPIVLLMYVKDGMIVFTNWFRNLVKLFFGFTIIVLQILLLLELANILNAAMNDIIAYSSVSLLILFTLLLIASLASVFYFSRIITNIFFKDNRVKAEINKNSLEGMKVDADVKNKSLSVKDENLSKTIKTNMVKTQKISTRNLKKATAQINKTQKETATLNSTSSSAEKGATKK